MQTVRICYWVTGIFSDSKYRIITSEYDSLLVTESKGSKTINIHSFAWFMYGAGWEKWRVSSDFEKLAPVVPVWVAHTFCIFHYFSTSLVKIRRFVCMWILKKMFWSKVVNIRTNCFYENNWNEIVYFLRDYTLYRSYMIDCMYFFVSNLGNWIDYFDHDNKKISMHVYQKGKHQWSMDPSNSETRCICFSKDFN